MGAGARRIARPFGGPRGGTADHSKFPELQRFFQTPEEVTATCLRCHNTASTEIMSTSHWLWARKTDKLPGREGTSVEVGKKNIINNFCIALVSNEPRCTSCHIGMAGRTARSTSRTKTRSTAWCATSRRAPTRNSPPAPATRPRWTRYIPENKKLYKRPDYARVAQSVGKPQRRNCGSCHFYGGAGTPSSTARWTSRSWPRPRISTCTCRRTAAIWRAWTATFRTSTI